ncbi:MAG TPA: GyrI-like domain-containing protein, partial [Fimbriimonas sp.]
VASELAEAAGFSPFHFSWLFGGLMGESPGEMLRRLRIERAAYCLGSSDTTVCRLAFESGYDSQEAFARAFRSSFHVAPSEFRRSGLRFTLPTPNGVHYDPTGRKPLVRPRETGVNAMNIEIRENVPGRRIVAMGHKGPYWQIGSTFGRLMAWVGQNQAPITGEMLAIYYDDPSSKPEAELQSDAAAVVAPTYKSDDPAVKVLDVAGGRYAVYIHKGSYSGLGDAWSRFYSEYLVPSGLEVDPSRNCFELYLNDCSQVPEDQLVTEIHEPIK